MTHTVTPAQQRKYEAKWALEREAERIATRCTDAYSAGAYANWSAVAEVCLKRGLSPAQTEAVLRSKWTRWARDAYHGRLIDGRYPAAALDAQFKKGGLTLTEAQRLTLGTFKPVEIKAINAGDLRGPAGENRAPKLEDTK